MADFYALQQVGVADGTLTPAAKADGGQVGAKVSSITASKSGTQALTTADRLYLGKVRAGERVAEILVTTDTSLGTSTLSIGTTGTPAKYVGAKTLTATDVPTTMGPKASTLDDGLLTADEDLWLSIGTANAAAAVLLSVESRTTAVRGRSPDPALRGTGSGRAGSPLRRN